MLSAEGCRQRRQRLWQQLDPAPDADYLLLADPIHLMYLANVYLDPFSLGAGFPAYLLVRRDGHAKLIHNDRMPDSVQHAHVEDRRVVEWYDGQNPGHGARQLAPLESVNPRGSGLRVHDRIGDPYAPVVIQAIANMRRRKDKDELDLLAHCMRAGEAGHAWARKNLRAGMSELDVFCGVNSACIQAAGHAVIVYGDFAVSPGSDRRGGPPTARKLQNGDMFILDFSVVIGGYRSDFTNTMVVGGQPNKDQQRLSDLCQQAMAAGEQQLRAGTTCQTVWDTVNNVFAKAGCAEAFGHHAGHGIGLSHPEAPFFVQHSTETLAAGDVVTLEPGLYVTPVGGIRIEHNYHVTEKGYERLSHHVITLA